MPLTPCCLCIHYCLFSGAFRHEVGIFSTAAWETCHSTAVARSFTAHTEWGAYIMINTLPSHFPIYSFDKHPPFLPLHWYVTHFQLPHSSPSHHLNLPLLCRMHDGKGQRVMRVLTGVPGHLFQHLGICLVWNKRVSNNTPRTWQVKTSGVFHFCPDLRSQRHRCRHKLTWEHPANPPTHTAGQYNGLPQCNLSQGSMQICQ